MLSTNCFEIKIIKVCENIIAFVIIINNAHK